MLFNVKVVPLRVQLENGLLIVVCGCPVQSQAPQAFATQLEAGVYENNSVFEA